MSPNEAADYVEGARRRWRPMYEASRVGWFMNAAPEDKSQTMQDIFPFEWDEKPKTKRVTKKQRDELRARAEQLARQMAQAKNGK